MTITAPRSIRANGLVVDVLIAGALTSLSLLAIAGGAADVGGRDPLNVSLLLLQTIPLVARRVAPVPVLAVTFGATFLHIVNAFGQGTLNESIGALVALYTVAEQCDRRVSVSAALVLGAGFATVFLMAGVLPQGLQGLLQTEISVALGWAFGDFSRTRRLVARLVADRERLRDAEREERAARAVQLERDRIARELHDVVTHHVSVVVIQAAAAQRALERRPEQVREALVAIEATGRQALADMRRMLGILGDERAIPGSIGAGDPAAAGTVPGSLEPMPGVDRLGELLERVRAAGLPVEIAIRGEQHPLDAGIELSAYRIVQEALTNALKYARGARARVELRYEPAALEIEVVDSGGRAPAGIEDSHDGRGLIGMRERVAMFGGRLETGRTSDGWRILARIPLADAAGSAR